MGFFNKTVDNDVLISATQQSEFLAYANFFVRNLFNNVYKKGTDKAAQVAYAKEWVTALGTKANTQFEISSILVTALNQIATLTGVDPLGNPMPTDLHYVGHEDGSGELVEDVTDEYGSEDHKG